MCDKIDIPRGKGRATDKMLHDANKGSRDFYKKNSNLITKLKNEFKNRYTNDFIYTEPSRINKYIYQYKRETEESYGRYYASDGCKNQVILDLEKLAKGHDYFDVQSVEISSDEKYIAFSVDKLGDRVCNIYYKEIFNDKLHLVSMNHKSQQGNKETKYINNGEFGWSRKFFRIYYITVDTVTQRENKLWYMDLDTGNKSLIYEEKDEIFSIDLSATDDDEHIILSSISKDCVDSYVIEEYANDAMVRCVFNRDEKTKYILNHFGDRWYALIIKGDNTEIVISYDLKKFNTFIPYDKNRCITDFYIKGGHALMQFKDLRNGKDNLVLIRLCDMKTKLLDLGDFRYTVSYPEFSNLDIHSNKVVMAYETYTNPGQIIEFDMITYKSKILKTKTTKNINMKDYGEKTVRINNNGLYITILYHKRFINKKNNKCFLYGYGSYGLEDESSFSRYLYSLLDRGFIYAIAHMRGSGYYGDKWYQDGKMLNKINTFNDFIECAEYLIKKGYTTPEKLTAYGASAGGLLMGAVINMRPELFNLVIMGVPFVDVLSEMCDDTTPLTTGEYVEWGDPHIKKYHDYMLSYDPIRNINPNNKYPNLLIFSNKNDTLVGYWVPYNYYEKIKESQVYKSGDKDVLLDIKTKYGHKGSSDKFESMTDIAEIYSTVIKYTSD